MMATLHIYERLRKVLDERVALEIAEAIGEAVNIYERMVTKEEFNELKQVVKELAEAQKRTEQKVEELAEAQEKTEQRLGILEEKMARLAEAQEKTEQRLGILEEKMARLAEAQEKTEQRMNKLEEKMVELAEAQRKTEESINRLTKKVEELNETVGGHSHTIGHMLEDKAILKLPSLLKKMYGIEVEGKLKRGFIENDRGEKEEANIYGYGKRDGERVLILGEGKSRFGKGDLKDFLKKVGRFERKNKVFPIIITYIFSSPKVEEEVKKLNLSYFLSFELEE